MATLIAAIITAFIGGLLAAGTGYFFERRRDKVRIQQTQILFKTAIIDDLKFAVSVYEKISDLWDKSKIVWFSTLNEIRESRSIYQNNKEWIYVFNNSDLRQKIFQYYSQSTECINGLEYQQRRKYEIEARFNDIIRDIKQKNPNISNENARNTTANYMENENREYNDIEIFISKNIKKLSDFKYEAQEIIKLLENI